MEKLTFKDIAYAADPASRERDAAATARNRSLEASLSPSPAGAPAAPSPWSPAPGGGVQRTVQARGVVETVRNVGSTVISETSPYTPPPVDSEKPYAQILIADIPKRVELVNRKLLAGDIKDAERERAAIEKFVEENRAELHEFTRYTGSDRLTSVAAKTAMDLVTGGWLSDDQKMLFDPKVNPKSASRDAMVRGYSPAAAKFLQAARYGEGRDAEIAAAALRAGGQADVAPGGRQRDDAQAPAPASFNEWTEYLDGGLKKVFTALPENLRNSAALGPDALVTSFRSAFDAGDADAGYALLGLATDAANSAAGSGELAAANAFKSAVRDYSAAMTAWGRRDDPTRAAVGARILTELAGGQREPAVGQRMQLAQTMKAASDTLDQFSSLGVPLSGDAAVRYAKVLHNLTFRSSAPLEPADQPVAMALTTAARLGNNIRVGVPTAADGKEVAPAAAGLGLIADSVKQEVQAAAASAIQNSSTVEDELPARAASLGRKLEALGAGDSRASLAAANLILSAAASGKEFDVSRLAETVGKAPSVRSAASSSGEPAAPAATPTSPVTSIRKVVERREWNKAAAAAPKVDSAGNPIPEADARAALQTAANASPNLSLFDALTGADATAVNVVSAGPGDRTAMYSAFVGSVAPAIPDLIFESSPMFRYLADEVPSNRLRDPEVRAEAAKRLKDAYAGSLELAAAGTDPAQLDAFADAQAKRIIDNLTLVTAAYGEGDTPFASSLGATPEMRKTLARASSEQFATQFTGPVSRVLSPLEPIGRAIEATASVVGPALASPLLGAARAAGAGALPGEATMAANLPRGAALSAAFSQAVTGEVSPEAAANTLAELFFAPVEAAVPKGKRGFAVAAKDRVRQLALFGTTQADEKADIAVNPLETTSEDVVAGYEAIKTLGEKLGKPVADVRVNQLINDFVPKALDGRGLSNDDEFALRYGVSRMAAEGKTADEIASAFNANLRKALATRAEAAAKAKEAELRLRREINEE